MAVPTGYHLDAGLELAAAGVHTLIEKPLATDIAEAHAARRGVRGARAWSTPSATSSATTRRCARCARGSSSGELGEIYQVATRRQGPFPNRIADVGVVKDLATHDIDLTAWVHPVAVRRGLGAHRAQERSRSTRTWSRSPRRWPTAPSPATWSTGCRRSRSACTVVTGERGAFVADTLHGDLTFHENGLVATEWEQVSHVPRRHRGQHHPLRDRRSRSRCASSTRTSATRCSARPPTSSPCARDWRPSPSPTPASASARERPHRRRSTTTEHRDEDRRRRPRQDRPAARRAVRRPRPRTSSASTSTPTPSRPSTPGVEPFPGEAHLAEHLARLVPAGRLRATTDYADAVPGADAVVVVVPLFVDDDGQPDFGWMDAATRDIGTPPDRRARSSSTRRRCRSAPPATAGSRCSRRAAAWSRARDFHLVFSPERVLTGRVFADLRKYPKLVGGLSRRRAPSAAVALLRGRARVRRAPRPGARQRRLGPRLAPRRPRWPSSPRRPTATSTSAWPTSSRSSPRRPASTSTRSSRRRNSQPYSHIHRPGIAVGGHCIPVYPRLYLSGDPDATVVRAAREANAAMPAHAVDRLAERRTATCRARGSSCSAPPTAAGSRRPRSPASSTPSRRCADRGADADRPRPDVLRRRARRARLRSRTTSGTRSTRSSSRPTTREYADLTPADLPGARLVAQRPTRPAPRPRRQAGGRRRRHRDGRQPARRLMPEPIHLSKADVTELEEQYVLAAIRSGWCAPLGPDVDAFEAEVAEFVGVDHALALSSGTRRAAPGADRAGCRPGSGRRASDDDVRCDRQRDRLHRCDAGLRRRTRERRQRRPGLLVEAVDTLVGARAPTCAPWSRSTSSAGRATTRRSSLRWPSGASRWSRMPRRRSVPRATAGRRHVRPRVRAVIQRQQDHDHVRWRHAAQRRRRPGRPRPQALDAGARAGARGTSTSRSATTTASPTCWPPSGAPSCLGCRQMIERRRAIRSRYADALEPTGGRASRRRRRRATTAG